MDAQKRMDEEEIAAKAHTTATTTEVSTSMGMMVDHNGGAAVKKVLEDSCGLLEDIFFFLEPVDWVRASTVNRRWKAAARYDELWKEGASQLWREKRGDMGVELLQKDADKKTNMVFHFHWRSLFSEDAINRLSVRDIRCLFQSFPQGRKQVREALVGCIEKNEMRSALRNYLPQQLELIQHRSTILPTTTSTTPIRGEGRRRGEQQQQQQSDNRQDRIVFDRGFNDLWFGSYASAVIDATRNTLTVDELCAPLGFQVFFKISQDDAEQFGNDARIMDPLPNTDNGEDADDADDDEKYKVIHHGTCYFDENFDFRMQTLYGDEEDGMYDDMEWDWIKTGRMIQVGNFPPLFVARKRDWSWQLENSHVILYPRKVFDSS
eukprot:CAMPEP_0198286548 /NCGR_PEP_ID=MMETSP1449-20131203/5611_1 /TAXON_ID=420275 /ORGANISM="Attheya septentrionalis, Strain CCMP2084" /LENGTH=377 /DNA_ID=CAMNT_0043984325 /DNA_START=135 /DNA_END=1268 /DNA_ORIENTATION=+